jgi:hypothetical protein
MLLPDSILSEFIDRIKGRLKIDGLLLSGSYAHGVPTEHSDLDVRVVLRNSDLTKERGIVSIEQRDVSYFAMSFIQYSQVMNEQFRKNSKFEARIIATSKIFYQKEGSDLTKAIINKAKNIIETPFPEPELNTKIANLYALRNHYKKVIQLKLSSALFNYNYFVFLHHLLSVYSLFSKNEHILEDKLEAFFFSEAFRKTHLMDDLPHDNFKKLFVNASQHIDKDNLEPLMQFMSETFDDANPAEFTINS